MNHHYIALNFIVYTTFISNKQTSVWLCMKMWLAHYIHTSTGAVSVEGNHGFQITYVYIAQHSGAL